MEKPIYDEMTEEQRKVLSDNRMELRAIYNSNYGKEHLAKMIKDLKVFGQIDPGQVDAYIVGKRNLVLDIMEKMGFFDDDNIDRIIEAMFRLPLIGY